MILTPKNYKKWLKFLQQESQSTRPLKCAYCQRSYKYRGSLKMHIKESHFQKVSQSSHRIVNRIPVNAIKERKTKIHGIRESQSGQNTGNWKSLNGTTQRMKKLHTIRAILEKDASEMKISTRPIEPRRTFSVIIRNPKIWH